MLDDTQMWHKQQQEYEQYLADQLDLPEHKRDGYAERMYELADMKRKEMRENHERI